jgi:cytochrome c peroxidase
VPSVFNVAFNARFAWNGRFADIGQQLDAAMSSRAAMNASFQQAARVVSRDPALSRAFEAVYAGGVSPGAVREALAVYCLSLVTPDARFDRYLRGELTLSAAEQSGYELFRELGCISCHQGVNLGGNLLQRFGVVVDYFAVHGSHSPADDGLFEETRDPADLHVFRVPSLRNVAVTAPYFHDGSAAELAQAVRDMAQFQLGRTLSQAETSAIVAFLEALSGELSPTRP